METVRDDERVGDDAAAVADFLDLGVQLRRPALRDTLAVLSADPGGELALDELAHHGSDALPQHIGMLGAQQPFDRFAGSRHPFALGLW